MSERGSSRDEPDKWDLSDSGYRWTCPYCGMSRVNIADGPEREENAIAALRAHILASDGAEHGPRNEVPSDEELTLSEYVSKVGGRR